MASLIFPDINVWLAILLADHVHREAVKGWWTHDQSETIAFVRFTQLGVLRLLTTAAVMNGLPLGMAQAWAAYDRLFADDRVAFVNEPRGLESHFRQHTQHTESSSKLWADAWLLAFAEHSGGAIVTFDKALAKRSVRNILLC